MMVLQEAFAHYKPSHDFTGLGYFPYVGPKRKSPSSVAMSVSKTF